MEIKKMRKSNIELLRIVLIIMVIAHHYVVNSGIKAFFTPAKMSAKMIGIEIFGCGGKIADRKSTRLNSSHRSQSRMPSSA